MPCEYSYGGVWSLIKHIKDPSERAIEHARLTGMKSPLTFHERKARRAGKVFDAP